MRRVLSTGMPNKRHAAGIAAAFIALAATPAAAHAQWQHTQAIIPAGANGGAAQVSLSPAGHGLVHWPVDGPSGGSPSTSGLATISSGGEIGTPRRTKGFRIAGQPAAQADGQSLVLTGISPTAFELNRLHWAMVSKDGRVGKRSLLTSRRLVAEPVLAANSSGDAVAVWTEELSDEDGGVAVRAALRRSAAGFGPPRTLLTDLGDGAQAAAAIDNAGRLVVAYGRTGVPQGSSRIVAWTGNIARGFDAARDVGPHVGRVDVAAALTGGRAVVAWGTQRGGEEAASPYVVRASRQTAAGSFGKPNVVDPGGPKSFPSGRLLLTAGPSGAAVLAWEAPFSRPASSPVRAAVLGADGRVGAVQRFGQGSQLGGLATQPGGNGSVAITWAGSSGGAVGLFHAVMPPRQRKFGASQHVGGMPARPATSVTPLTAAPPAPAYDARGDLRLALAYPGTLADADNGQLTLFTLPGNR